MLLATEKTLNHELTVLCDDCDLIPNLVTVVFK
jgi:hypothetical protein